ncbi:hypothetical protein QJQ45_007365 [Haematococcus lacustris]|nr:hypothetical protein QJQ45_007365 [Haematococcus lacustris]
MLKHMQEWHAANNTVLSCSQFVKADLSLPGVTVPCKLNVMPSLLPDFDVLLGNDWLNEHEAVMSYQDKTLSLACDKGEPVVLPCPPADKSESGQSAVSNPASFLVNALRAKPPLASAKVAARWLRKGGTGVLALITVDNSSTPDPAPAELDLPPGVSQALNALLDEYADVFAPITSLPPERPVGHAIPLVPDARPSVVPQYRMSQDEHAELKKQVQDLLAKGMIEPSSSPFAAPILFVKKKSGELRMCLDYRQLNKITIRDQYPLPRVDDLFDKLSGCTVFSSLDLQAGYNQIRITPEDVPKTAFRTPDGHYQFKVLSFGLCNAPATFQRVMNDAFAPVLNQCALVYLDDILVMSKSVDEHLKHLRKVFDLLRLNKLFAKQSKCEFMRTTLKFLGHVIFAGAIAVDPESISSWPVPQSLQQLQSFLGAANFVRKFVHNFSVLAAPLTDLCGKAGDSFLWHNWPADELKAFASLKAAVAQVPMLRLPDHTQPFQVYCDASLQGVGAVLMQDGYPLAYLSKKLSSAERNYTTGEQELLALITACKEWRCYLEGVPFTLFTDHKPLTALPTQKVLSRRQARWMEFLSRFTFDLQYLPGDANPADPLSRIPAGPQDCAMVCVVTTRRQAKQSLERGEVRAAQALPQVPPVGTPSNAPTAVDALAPRPTVSDNPVAAHHSRLPELEAPSAADTSVHYPAAPAHPLELADHLVHGYRLDPAFTAEADLSGMYMDDHGLWRRTGKGTVMVPNDPELREYILHEMHDAAYAGHVGITKTLERLSRVFYWDTMRADVRHYVTTCDACQRDKSSTLKPGGLLNPLSIPDYRWESVSMDLITKLPSASHGFDAICVFVDRLSKMVHFVPCKESMNAKGFARLFVDNVFKLHGLPKDMVSDRGPHFHNTFWHHVQKLLGMRGSLSSSYHPQSDGQTERYNRVLEEMLRHYISPTQADWPDYLSLAEFAVNNSWQESIKSTPFLVNTGQSPITPMLHSLPDKGRCPEGLSYATWWQDAVAKAKLCMQAAQQRQAAYANQDRREVHYKVGQMVLLSTKNMRLKPGKARKLLPRFVGPFKVLGLVGQVAVNLQLPASMSRLHPVFHVSLIKPYTGTDVGFMPPPVEWLDEEPVYYVERLLDHRHVHAGKAKEYLVQWEGYDADHNTWEPRSNLVGCDKILAEYNAAHNLKRLLTTADWKELQGRLILIKQGMQHKNLIEPIFWLADPMEQATTTQLEQHYVRPDHIDLSGHDDQPPTISPPAATPHPLTTSNNAIKRKNTYAAADPPARPRHREAATAKEDAATPPPPTRNEKPSTKTDPKKPRSKKGAKNTSYSKDRHTQTLMSRYLTNTQAAPTATIPSPPVPCPTTKAPPILPTQPHQTPSRQHLTLTTLNVRGLYRARRDVSHLIHHHHPDILILTETKTHHKKDTPGWLKVTTQDYTLHRHGGHSEVLIGIKHDLAIQMQATLVPPSTEAEINSRCVILTLSQHHSDNLTIVATYWPSGCNEDALPQHIRTATRHLPGSLILAGDLNATMKTEDRSEHTEYTQDRMMREFATEMRLSEADPGDRAWTYQQPHCNSRIDAILTRDARPGPEHRTIVDTHAYLSDHRPLIATLTTARMGIHLAQTQLAQSHKHTVLTTPITNSDREAFRLAVQQPSSGTPQLHAQLAAYLSPLFTEATDFLANLDKANPHQPKRLTQLAGLHPRQAVDMAATMLTTLLETCKTTAMKTCTTKTLTRGGQHYQRRTMCKIRLALGKKLKTTRNLSRQARLLFKQNGAHPTIEDLIPDTDTSNIAIREAVLARQDDDPTDNHVQAALAKLTNSYRDQIHQLDDDDSALAIAQARVRMQQLICTQPKKANKYILRPSRTSHKGLQALTDPATRRVCTDPADLNRIITAAYGQKLSPPTPKTGHYTDTQTRNYPWARAKADDAFAMHACQNIHWLHTAIMDKASFQECLSRLAGGKAPGPDGIENEIIKMLPWEMRDTIHQLFIIMWATGCTPTTWKTSDTCLLYKDKGQETDLNAYRPVGLANTIYKLWTSLITKTLYEYAEANGMLSKCQAGFRSHRDTTQQLQMLVMALEDAKLAKADIYALMVDFTSAFNTTCQDKLLWIMHDLGFPTDATDAVKDLYTGATTRFKTPYGPTDPVRVDRGTIQGDSLSPFLFLIYIEPLLRWLQVGARGYKFQSVENDSDNRYTIGSIDYADDVAILCNSISNTRVQADKLSAYSDLGHLIISHSKTLATAALHKAHHSGRCSTQADAEKEARKQMQDLRLQGKPVTFLRPTAPFPYLGVMLTMTLNWKPQHTAMITQLRQKLDRLRRSFASARQAIHIVKTAIIPSLAYSFCVVPCTPGDLDLFDRAVNQCVKHKLNLPLGTPNAVIRDDIDKLGLGISSAAQEYHARNTTALVSSLQSADNTYAHISRCMLHKQITWLYAQAAKHGHRIPNLLQHTLRARQLLHTTTANLFATHEGAPLYPKETKALGQLITQSASPLPRDIVSACITCLKSLGLAHPSELICQDNIHIMSGDGLRKRFGTKVKQKHIIALNRLTAMATMDHCPTATEAKTILGKRDTTLTLPADQRRIRAWAAGLTELTPHTTAHTGPRYTDIRAYMTTKTLAKDTQPPTPKPTTATARSKLTNNVPKPPTAKQPTPQPRIGSKRPAEDRHTEADDRHTQTIPDVVTHIPIMTLANLSTWKADTVRQHKNEQLGIMLGAMYGHQESITAIDGWHWNGNNQESYYNVHWRPTIIEKWALQMYKKEGYTPAHTEDICRADAEHVCTCELCWEPKEDSPMCNNYMRAYHPACLAKTGLAGQARDDHWLCPVCAHGEDDLKTAMRKSVETDLIKAHWHPTTEFKPLILAHIDYTDKKDEYDADNSKRQEARRRPPDAALPEHTRQGLPDPHTWIPRCTDLHSRATFHTSPVNPQTDIVGTGRCEITLQNHSHITTQAMCGGSQGPNLPQHSLIEHVVAHDEAGRTVGLINKTTYQNLTTWLQHTPHPRDPAMELAALLRRNNTQSTPQPLLAAQNKAITTLYNTQYFPNTVQRWANPLTVRAETTTYWSPDINDTAYGAHHNCLLVRHTGLSTWNVPAEDALALKCIKHAIHSATMEEATATILLILGKKGISYPKHIAMLKSYPEYCQHLATIPLDKSRAATKSCKHATLLTYIVWNKAGQQLVTKGNPQGWLANTATALHPRPERHPKHNQPSKHVQPTQLPSGHYKHTHLPADRELPATGHMRHPNQIAPPFCTTSSMVIPNWRTVTYTNGSCMQGTDRAPARKVGAGVYTPVNDERLTIALPDHSTINRAELAAIHAAIKSGATHIATDSLCSIYQIRRALANPMSLRTHPHRDILADIATLIMNSRDTIHLRKVRAHSGIIGNEAADTLAKHAAMYPEQAHTQAPHENTEQQTWLSATTETGTTIPLPDCRHSVRTHMRAKHKLGLANQDSIYYQMSQDIARVAAKGSCERVMLDPGIPTAAQRTALLYRTGGLYNQRLAMRWGKTADDRCPLCGEADSATHLLSGCTRTAALVQERHNGAGRLITKAIDCRSPWVPTARARGRKRDV